MVKKLSDIELSDTVIEALNNLERFELEFTIEEPRAAKVEGRLVGFIRDNTETKQ